MFVCSQYFQALAELYRFETLALSENALGDSPERGREHNALEASLVERKQINFFEALRKLNFSQVLALVKNTVIDCLHCRRETNKF